MRRHFPSAITHYFFFPLFLILVMFGSLYVVFYFFFSATSSFSSTSPVLLHEAVTVSFSQPVFPDSYRGTITISPSPDGVLQWADDFRSVSIVPKDSWKPDVEYRLRFGQGQSRFFLPVSPVVFSFRTVRYPEVVSVIPSDGSSNVLVGIEDPIAVSLDIVAEDFYIDMLLDPPMEFYFQREARPGVVSFLPKKSLEPGMSYNVSVIARHRTDSDDEGREIYSGRFETLAIPENPRFGSVEERLHRARLLASAKISTGKYIHVDRASQIMILFEEGKVVDTFLISSGQPGMDTPTGTFAIENKHPRPWSRQYELFMPFWMAITPDGKYGIHELPEWPGGYKEGANHLGIPVSHGCVRLGVGSAEFVYDWAEIGTPVIVK
ncbi:MAG: L,D-transpeptidase family protein [Candidatus Moranbacteria bacterium]|nr:L,D-transpeptidase family protein [Candidatus Moranbacteria bacterium]